MNSQKKIEIHQSSFLSLKAELLKKREEVRDAKLSETPNKPTVVKKVKTKSDNVNEGVDERNARDLEEIEEENDVFQKSKRALEAKSKLYDELSKNPESAAHMGNILVDFRNKERENEEASTAAYETSTTVDEASTAVDEASTAADEANTAADEANTAADEPNTAAEEASTAADEASTAADEASTAADEEKTAVDEAREETPARKYVDEDQWVDFVDCLGRTKRCHKDDLEAMKVSDDKLRLSLFGKSSAKERRDDGSRKVERDVPGQPDLCSDDMRRKMLREKWEEEEKQLADRKDIHYQHVLFDGQPSIQVEAKVLDMVAPWKWTSIEMDGRTVTAAQSEGDMNGLGLVPC